MMNAVRVDPSNTEQARAWDGDEGAHWAANADRYDRSVADYQVRFLEASSIDPSDRVLDIGCGTGQTTLDAARIARSGSALGVDLSGEMIEIAKGRAAGEGLGNATFEQADAQIHPFEAGGFDVAISRTGAMFFGDPVAAFTNIGRALRPAGRLALLTWQPVPDNEWIREIATAMAAGRELPTPPPEAPGPFSFSDPGRVRSILTDAGFREVSLEPMTGRMYFGPAAEEAYHFLVGVAGWMLKGLDADGRSRALGALRASIDAHESADGVTYNSATWLISAKRAP